jgi:uncharacterized membrane protein
MQQLISRKLQLLNLRQSVLILIGLVLIVRLIAHVPSINWVIW